ncbi:MAG: hypothetical protein PHX70_13970 [Clostridium sp.]|nr:hypothetical protein [Clostridium sp.]
MSTISSVSNSNNVYTQAGTGVTNTQGDNSTSVHHHHHHGNHSKDSIELSQNATEQINNSTSGGPSDILSSLVSNGTITQSQADSIKSVFQSASQANMSGTYSSSINPIGSLVSNGTISQDQVNSIKGAFQSAARTNYYNQGQQDVTETIGNDSSENTQND